MKLIAWKRPSGVVSNKLRCDCPACGCRMYVPTPTTFTVRVHRSCRKCHTPWRVRVRKMGGVFVGSFRKL